jgi:hypothetical protein
MTNEVELLHHPDTREQPPHSFRQFNLLTLIAAVLLSAFVAGAGGYWLGIRTQQGAPPSQSRESVQIPTHTQLSSVTMKQFNPSSTLAFYFTSKKQVFEPNDNPQIKYGITNDPFNICFNGDTSYVVQSTIYPGTTSQAEITPHVMVTDSGKSWDLSFIGEVKAPNGCVRITRWVDDTHLLREACGGDLNEGCECHLVDVQKHSLKDLGANGCLLSGKK